MTMDLYRTCRKLSSLIENQIVEGVRSPSPEIFDSYLKNSFQIPYVVKHFLDFISDMGVTEHRHYDR